MNPHSPLSDPPSRFASFLGRWSFSLLLGAAYLAVFNLWRFVERTGTIISALLLCALLIWRLVAATRRGYFVNRWDAFLHAVVVLDILLEAILIPAHQTVGFYWCALAFAVVIGGYRGFMLHRRILQKSLPN